MKIPVRYIGAYPVTLKDPTGVLDGQGRPLTTGLLEYGDTIMMEETEILGETLFEYIRGKGLLKSLGPGRIILPEHVHAADDPAALEQLGYHFHMGRSDFEPLLDEPVIEEETPPAKPAKSTKSTSAETKTADTATV